MQTELGIISALVANLDKKMIDNTVLINRIRSVCKEMVDHSKEPMKSLAAGSRHVPNESLVQWFQDVMPCLNIPSYTQRLMSLTDVEQAKTCLLRNQSRDSDYFEWSEFPNETREELHKTLAEMYDVYKNSMLDDCASLVTNSSDGDDVMFCKDLIIAATDTEKYISCGMLVTLVRNGYFDFHHINGASTKVLRTVLDAFTLYYPESASDAQLARSMIPRKFLRRIAAWRAHPRTAQALKNIIEDKLHILDAYRCNNNDEMHLSALIKQFCLNHMDNNLTNPETQRDASPLAPMVELIPNLHFGLLFDEDYSAPRTSKPNYRPSYAIKTVEEWRYKHAGKYTTLTRALVVLIVENRLNNGDKYRREIRWMIAALCTPGYANVARIILTAAACVGDLQTYATALYYGTVQSGDDLPIVEHIAVPLCHAAYCGQAWFVRALLHLNCRDDAVLCGAMQRGMVFDTNSFFTGTRVSADIVRVPGDSALNGVGGSTKYGKNFFKKAFTDALRYYSLPFGVVISDLNRLAHVLGTQQPDDGKPLWIVMRLLNVIAQRGMHDILQLATDLFAPLREMTWSARGNYYTVSNYWHKTLEPYMRSAGSQKFSAVTLAEWHGRLMHAALVSGSQKTIIAAGELLLPLSGECFSSTICHVAMEMTVARMMARVSRLGDRMWLSAESFSSITMRLSMTHDGYERWRLETQLCSYLKLAFSISEEIENHPPGVHRGAYFWTMWSMICGNRNTISNERDPTLTLTLANLLGKKHLACCCGGRRGRRCYSAVMLSILVRLAGLGWNDILTMLNGHTVHRYCVLRNRGATVATTALVAKESETVLTMQRSILQHIIRFNSCPNMLEALVGSRSPPAVYEAVLQRSLQMVPSIAERGVAMAFHPPDDLLLLLGKSRVPLPIRIKDRQVIYSEGTDVMLYALGNRNQANWQADEAMANRFLRVQSLLHASLNAHIPVPDLADIVLDYMTDR
jgi:hypothetical protein